MDYFDVVMDNIRITLKIEKGFILETFENKKEKIWLLRKKKEQKLEREQESL